jgi:hypothetical protein
VENRALAIRLTCSSSDWKGSSSISPGSEEGQKCGELKFMYPADKMWADSV